MAFYSGAVNSFADLRTALVDACAAEGWTWADSILSKGVAHVRPYVSSTNTFTEGLGLLIQGGTGKSGSTLTGASDVIPRLGRPGAFPGFVDIAFPASYKLHVFSGPDEVFLFLRHGVDRFSWLAFGVSDVPGLGGTGLWLGAIARRGYMASSQVNSGFAIENYRGGNNTSNLAGTACASPGLFWVSSRAQTDPTARQDCIHANIDGEGWSGAGDNASPGAFNAIFPVSQLVAYSPSAWNTEAPLLPIMGHVWRASSKCSLVVDVRNARYVRVDNYEPEQVISIGPDRWRIYPFHQKNTSERNGASSGIGHSGTFGIAIRYDGP